MDTHRGGRSAEPAPKAKVGKCEAEGRGKRAGRYEARQSPPAGRKATEQRKREWADRGWQKKQAREEGKTRERRGAGGTGRRTRAGQATGTTRRQGAGQDEKRRAERDGRSAAPRDAQARTPRRTETRPQQDARPEGAHRSAEQRRERGDQPTSQNARQGGGGEAPQQDLGGGGYGKQREKRRQRNGVGAAGERATGRRGRGTEVKRGKERTEPRERRGSGEGMTAREQWPAKEKREGQRPGGRQNGRATTTTNRADKR